LLTELFNRIARVPDLTLGNNVMGSTIELSTTVTFPVALGVVIPKSPIKLLN